VLDRSLEEPDPGIRDSYPTELCPAAGDLTESHSIDQEQEQPLGLLLILYMHATSFQFSCFV